MTEKETILEMLKRRSIQYEETAADDRVVLEIPGGYPGFYTRMTFSKDGELQTIEAFE